MTQWKARTLEAPRSAPRGLSMLLLDEHPLMRSALRHVIETEWAAAKCEEAGDEAAALQVLQHFHVDVVLLELLLGESNGLAFLKRVTQVAPDARVLVFSACDETVYAERAVRAGACGYISKSASAETIIAAIRTVLRGGFHVSPQVTGRILQHFAGHAEDSTSDVERLSDREMETFESIGSGLGSRQIAQRLCVSVKTVEAYRQRIKGKLGISTSPQLARRAAEWVLTNV